ncbi:hypothetical protein F511_30180 [Dorcoceras hygrometricum]|uniref:CCHC-type domain-containing protein n=1 Tax=Dorcoceras hygrometricum TaxID=472368 RepID=A0A2Z7CFQ5_9LAMI|nr:hypothetical protein F511_30180 [Dorcoceras hygrometricum]
MKINIAFATTDGAPEYVEKRRHEYTNEEKNKANLDNVARDILYKTLDKNMFSKIKTCTTAKEIWEKLIQICEGNDEMKENKLTVAQQKYESIKMKDGETMAEFDERFSAVVIEFTSLGKEYINRKMALKVMRALPREWDVKTMDMRESKDLNKLELHDLFANLKAYEFELETRSKSGPSTSQPTKALYDKVTTDQNCFNCGRPGHFAADCNRPKKRKDSRGMRRKMTDPRKDTKDRRMRTRADKRPSKKQ